MVIYTISVKHLFRGLAVLTLLAISLATSQQKDAITAQTLLPGLSVTMNGPPVARKDLHVEALSRGLSAAAPSASTPSTASVFVVTTLADTGDGSLRKAILDANANPGTDIIDFDMPGTGVQTIFPLMKLPNIMDPVIIDGTTQTGYAGSPVIALDGTDLFGFDMIDVFANDCVIRGLAINRVRGGTGIVLYGDTNTVVGNYFGLDPSGTSAPGIDYNGIILVGASNRVGGTLAQNRNYFAGTGSPAIALSGATATGNIVEGNFTGTDPTGTVKLGTHSESVIIINGASDNTVGGSASGMRNVFAGSALASGISIVGAGTHGNVILGNYIGTDVTGTVSFGHQGNGIFITGADSTVIGDLTSGAGNVICGNASPGIFLDSTARKTRILGNRIGISANTITPLPNSKGIVINGSPDNRIEGNIICGNTLHGIEIRHQGATGNVLVGNLIGFSPVTGGFVENDGHGVLINASDNVIGGSNPGDGNVIAGNFGAGVSVGSGVRNTITQNAIYSNYGLGIDLAPGGVNPNDTLDTDTGANDMQNYPVLDSLRRYAQSIEVWGRLITSPSRSYTVEFFADSVGDVSGYGQGMRFLGSTQVTTGASGTATFDVQLLSTVSLSEEVTSTATDDSGNTSEFSRGIGKNIRVTDPGRGILWVVGEQDTIMWRRHDTSRVQIDYSVDDGKTYKRIVDGVAGDGRAYVWKVPKEFSAKCRVRVRDPRDSTLDGISERFKIKGWILTKYSADSSFIAYSPRNDGWNFPNDSVNMWPQSWFSKFDYADSLDPYTGAGYPLIWPYFIWAKPADFPDWPLFVYTFGTNTCYHSQFTNPPLYKVSTVLLWALMKGAWGGSCYGLAMTSLLGFDNPTGFQNFAGIGPFANLFQVGLNDHMREVINSVFLGQFSSTAKANDRLYSGDPPSVTLAHIKAMFASDTRDDRVIGFDYKPGFLGTWEGHAVVPYKIEANALDTTVQYIYVYDNNYPGDTTARFEVNTTANVWSYPKYGWSGTQHMYLSDPASDYLSQPVLFLSAKPASPPVATEMGNGLIEVYAPRSDKFLIADPQGKMVGWQDTGFVNTITGTHLVLPLVRPPVPPLAYSLPQGTYSLESIHHLDSTCAIGVVTDSLIYEYERTSGATTTTDHLRLDGGISFRNDNASVDSLRITGLTYQSDVEKFCQISDLPVGPGDSLRMAFRGDRSIDLLNSGTSRSIDLRLGSFAAGGGGVFEHKNVLFAGPALMRIVPAWENIQHAPVKILIDHGMHGTFDDSISVANQLTSVVPGNQNPALPQEFFLWQNYPNPFNPRTGIRYQVSEVSNVKLIVYDLLGRELMVLVNERKLPGQYEVTFDGSGLASGVYYYRLTAGSFTAVRKMILLK